MSQYDLLLDIMVIKIKKKLLCLFFIQLFLFDFFSSLHYIDTAAHVW